MNDSDRFDLSQEDICPIFLLLFGEEKGLKMWSQKQYEDSRG